MIPIPTDRPIVDGDIATYWLDPARLRSYAAYTDIRKWDRWQNSTGVAERYELVSFKQS